MAGWIVSIVIATVGTIALLNAIELLITVNGHRFETKRDHYGYKRKVYA